MQDAVNAARGNKYVREKISYLSSAYVCTCIDSATLSSTMSSPSNCFSDPFFNNNLNMFYGNIVQNSHLSDRMVLNQSQILPKVCVSSFVTHTALIQVLACFDFYTFVKPYIHGPCLCVS